MAPVKHSLFCAFAVQAVLLLSCSRPEIDRRALVCRNNPHVTSLDTLSSLTVGNGRFAFTVDGTGLQSFPEMYAAGVPLGTQSQWGWHSFPNPEGFVPEDAFRSFDFGHGHEEVYSCQFREPGRSRDASEWLRANPHRLHLGCIGFSGLTPEDISDIDQTLDLWTGTVRTRFNAYDTAFELKTSCDPDRDLVAADIRSEVRVPVSVRFPYPTGAHSDDACDWDEDESHVVEVVAENASSVVLRHILDSTTYYLRLSFRNAFFEQVARNEVQMVPRTDRWWFTAEFSATEPELRSSPARDCHRRSASHWREFWENGAAVDFSGCTDPRAPELERRVVLSQYLLAVNCAGDTPPQETGLTYNSWFGKFHMEMIWWHQAQFALWGREDLLERSLKWYSKVEPVARDIAGRQGFKGVRWMKMTDPSGAEAPSNVGSFLIWQQPHPIYLAELVYRARPCPEVLDRYFDLVQSSAEFMADYASYDAEADRYVLKGCIAAQETLKADKTVNPPFELSYWHFGLATAQLWRERKGLERIPEWDEIIAKLSPLASRDGLYLAAESEPDTYSDIRMYSDHMAVLAALGVLPATPQIDPQLMRNTFDWVFDNWNWDQTWGWDYPTTCMDAVRLGEPEKALDALLMDKRTNTYLPNGHNCQDARLRCYLPGNGGLLAAVALMCAGWDGCGEPSPGFPKDGSWNVRWEGLRPLP